LWEPAFAGILDKLFRDPPSLRPAITPNDDFYVTSYRSPPDIRADQWSLRVTGLVEQPLTLTYPQMLARPAVSEIVTLECVGNGLAADAISTARWEGVPLKVLLEEAGASAQAVDVVFRAADGYSDSIPLSRAIGGDVLVAHAMNGVPLPRGHGFPARIIVPGIYGMKNVQWLTEIEVVAQDYQGYYQQKGWSDQAIVKTSSHIDVPSHGGVLKGREAVVRGYAFVGTRRIAKVELSTDGGGSWREAALEPELAPAAWRFWSYRWELPKPGRYSLAVRATDGTGRLQTTEEQAAFPDGAAGLHEVTVTVQA
jgi:DMSO/TMAO reductase YedYZ molybdopterin-dependent catalytic subunit